MFLTDRCMLVTLAFFILLAVLFYLFPQMDLLVSSWFYVDHQWLGDSSAVATSIYGLFRYLPYWLIPVLLICLGLTWVPGGLPKNGRRTWMFLLLTLLLGPGLLVHGIFKDGFERPRPRQVVEFEGTYQMVPAFVINQECHRKCKSFVSGHAAMGFYLMVLAWVSRRRVWLWAGVGVGSLVSLVRITQGGHFLSDVLFAGVLCWLVYLLLARWLLGHWQIRPAS
ncbi:phosphatase PAP2 family protein [Parathalassolituus penaei]|uniref:Phosphatase PAP2 family protein n=1 Tax=Parathalassolituus penaei TaxID=2997323 RepID=A0A9X3EPC9_9GAMM|nr:phosphatase PAP2 family protein [Parathalassolituus penaei]MCY0966388.1 phosphatase PAP2 family protein [Parathalassolituus penaei]